MSPPDRGIGAGGERDRDRLVAIARSADRPSLDVLQRVLPPDRAARVADLGCGNASLAAELARSRPDDVVWAVDRDTSLVAPEGRPANLEVVRADVRDWRPPAPADVLHARFLLSHLADRGPVLGHLVSGLASRGALVVTEALHLDHDAHPDVAPVLQAYRAVAEADGLCFAFARRVAGLMQEHGLIDVHVDVRATRLGGGESLGTWVALVRRVEDRLGVSAAELQRFADFARSPVTFEIPQLVVTTTGRRPGVPQAVQL